LFPTVKALLNEGIKVTALRDATRGGVSAVLNEWAKQSDVCIEAKEESIPVSDEVNGICEMLGFEPTALANEGTFLVAVDKKESQKALEVLKRFHQNAAYIADVTKTYPKKVVLHSEWGTKRFLESPTGELLPRIC
jgi:hydrogenase expression/formation protein HypE